MGTMKPDAIPAARIIREAEARRVAAMRRLWRDYGPDGERL